MNKCFETCPWIASVKGKIERHEQALAGLENISLYSNADALVDVFGEEGGIIGDIAEPIVTTDETGVEQVLFDSEDVWSIAAAISYHRQMLTEINHAFAFSQLYCGGRGPQPAPDPPEGDISRLKCQGNGTPYWTEGIPSIAN